MGYFRRFGDEEPRHPPSFTKHFRRNLLPTSIVACVLSPSCRFHSDEAIADQPQVFQHLICCTSRDRPITLKPPCFPHLFSPLSCQAIVVQPEIFTDLGFTADARSALGDSCLTVDFIVDTQADIMGAQVRHFVPSLVSSIGVCGSIPLRQIVDPPHTHCSLHLHSVEIFRFVRDKVKVSNHRRVSIDG